MTPRACSLFDTIPVTLQEELFLTLAEADGVRIERIVSEGHTTPLGEWYEQDRDEWVLLVSGGATLLFESNAALVTLLPGEYVLIPAGCRHRVERTDSAQKTVWLAVHFKLFNHLH